MAVLVEERSKITAKGQTTIPKAVRQALGVSYGGEIAFRVDEQGVSVRRVDAGEADPVIGSFLVFLAQDLARHPQTVTSFPSALVQHMAELTQGIEVTVDDEIDGPVDL